MKLSILNINSQINMRIITKRACPHCRGELNKEQRKHKITTHQCEICDEIYYSQESALKCEAKGTCNPRGTIGEVVAIVTDNPRCVSNIRNISLGKITSIPDVYKGHYFQNGYDVRNLEDTESIGTIYEGQLTLARALGQMLITANKTKVV